MIRRNNEQIDLWVQTITGMELDENGGMRLLAADAWQAGHKAIKQVGFPIAAEAASVN
jgi:hypothetical protein